MIGVHKRIIVVAGQNATKKTNEKILSKQKGHTLPEPILMYNPEITKFSKPYETKEGCLSLSGVRSTTRYEQITVYYLDEQFNERTEQFSGFTAQIIQHEIDHCNGILIQEITMSQPCATHPQASHVVHEITPVFNEYSRVLLLGTIPSPKSRQQGFFYGHPQNRFWRVLAALFDEPLPETIEEKRDLCLRHHLALWDVLSSCNIKGASDASITNAQPNDLSQIIKNAPIQTIITTGVKAGQLYHRLCESVTGMPCSVLPSTSPANSRVSFSELCEAYRQALTPYIEFDPSYPTLDVPEVVNLEQTIAKTGTSLYTLMHRAGKFLAYETENSQSNRANYLRELLFYAATAITVEMAGQQLNTQRKQVLTSILFLHLEATGVLKAEPAHTTACEQTENLETYPNARILINPTYEEVEQSLSQADLIIDALLGTGFSGDTIREPFATWITLSDQSNLPIVAADVPSGFSAQTGNAATPCIRAAHTVTMIALKTGLTHPNAQKYCGTIRVAPLIDTTPYLA